MSRSEPQLAPSDIDVRSPSCGLEMGLLASIDRFVDELASQGVLLDGLINNAGMVPISGGITAEGFEPLRHQLPRHRPPHA